MPTGYTADIAKGITFEEYALNCAKAFGACITMRDDPANKPIPEEFKVSEYHTNALAEDERKMQELMQMSEEEISLANTENYERLLLVNEKNRLANEDLGDKYEAMLAQVRKWTPPSSDHDKYKAFMISQIQESIEWDCSGNFTVPKKQTNTEWFNDKLDTITWNVNYHSKELKKEKEQVAGRNKWIKQLRKSLI